MRPGTIRRAVLSPVRAFAAVALVVAGGSFSFADAQDGKIYWTDANGYGGATAKVARADFDGGHAESLVVPPSVNPRFLALDPAGGHMYWTDIGRIDRANLDGSGVVTLVSGFLDPLGLALDVPGGKIYWTDETEGNIRRANLTDGSGVEEIVTGLDAPRGLALDLVHGKMYWTDTGAHNVQRANLDGSDREVLVFELFGQGIALDVAGGKMYWSGNLAIRRANLDGTSAETVVASGNPIGIALDLRRGKMYWTENQTNKVQRGNLDGSAVEDVVAGNFDEPWGIALYQTTPIITGAGAGGGPHVRAMARNPEGSLAGLASFLAYDPNFRGGVHVAAGDVDGDGRAEIIVGAGPGGGPHVRVLSRNMNGTLTELAGFFAYSPAFTGGVDVAAGDVDGDGRAEIITGAGPGGGPHVRVFKRDLSGSLAELTGLFAYSPAFTGGAYVAAGDVDGDGRAEIITGAGPGGGPHVRVFKREVNGSLTELTGFFAYSPAFTGGVSVASADLDGDGHAEVITGAGPGGGPHVRVFSRRPNGSLIELAGFLAYDPAFGGGVFVAAEATVSP